MTSVPGDDLLGFSAVVSTPQQSPPAYSGDARPSPVVMNSYSPPPPTNSNSSSFTSTSTTPPPSRSQTSGSSSWSSILEKQWYNTTRHLYLLITTSNCTIPGGVETLLRSASLNSQNTGGQTTNIPAPSTNAEAFDAPIGLPVTNRSSVNAPRGKNTWKNFSSAIQKTVQKGTQSLERQMHTMAIKADGGKNPDKIWVTLERSSISSSYGKWEEIGVTEHLAIRDKSNILTFPVPLLMEEGWLTDATFRLTVKVKSGAPLLGNKVYDLGNLVLQGRQLQLTEADHIDERLDSTILTGDARLILKVVKDVRWVHHPTTGWSLTDPSQQLGGSTFFPPLCQVYGKPPLIAIERAVESTVVLPVSTAMTRLLVESCQISVNHAVSVSNLIKRKAMKFDDGFQAMENNCGDGSVQVFYLQKFPPERFYGRVYVGIHYLPHLSVFEQELGMGEVPMSQQQNHIPSSPAVSLPFYPPLGNQLGRLRFEVHMEASHSMGLGMEVGTTVPPQEAIVEGYLDVELDKHEITNITVVDKMNKPVGVLMVMASIQGVNIQESGPTRLRVMSAQAGLPDLMGMEPLTDSSPLDATAALPTDIRSRQLSTMGPFYTADWIALHAQQRQASLSALQKRFLTYQTHLTLPNPEPQSDKRKLPSPFRPSSSKSEEILSGIPFNVHHQSLVIQKEGQELASCSNITCGAPSDHARGYSKGPAGAGGLRRLEISRNELALRVKAGKSQLIGTVADYMRRYMKKHIPLTHINLQSLRRSVIELEQKLTSATWEIALRRGNCFSQAMAIAMTNYLSNVTQKENECYVEQWRQHGYLICFEGMLSTAGKEMGMIEDAAAAVDMLGRVGVRLLPGDIAAERKVQVVGSDYLEWLTIERFHNPEKHPGISVLVQVGVKKTYLESCVPPSLRYNLIPFKPILFQMGVDIRQWGANTGVNLRKQLTEQKTYSKQQSVTDDGDDDNLTSPKPEDYDLLTKLNYEAFRKLNSYAHAVAKTIQAENQIQVDGVGVIHPHLKDLWNDLQDSAGKMQHGVLDHAAKGTHKLGGGHVVYCKSGKDRTAMQVTYKQAQFLNKFTVPEEEGTLYADATMMRIHGTRLAICEKNVGQPKYAFNALQAKFMPEMLKPPPSVLAGFLKGGKVFSKEGFVES